MLGLIHGDTAHSVRLILAATCRQMTRAQVLTPHILQLVLQTSPPMGKPPKREVDNFAPSSSELKTYVEQYLYCPHTFS
jgi:hypothetical protein